MKTNKKYDLIYIDPPWSYEKKVGQGVADKIYNTMELLEILKLPIKDLLKDNGVCWCWVTFPMLLKEIPKVIDCWGLDYVTVGFNWIKLNDNGRPFFGIGHHTKSNGEICLILRKGKGLKVLDNTISQVIMTKKDRHSRKPHICYTKLENLYGSVDRLEMFARDKREGWDAWGNQVPKLEQKIISKQWEDGE